MRYFVTWEIDKYAETPEEAALEAFGHMNRPGTSATFFTVYDDRGDGVSVDLQELCAVGPKAVPADLAEAATDELGRPYVCKGCARPEIECSASPCAGVIADRGEEED